MTTTQTGVSGRIFAGRLGESNRIIFKMSGLQVGDLILRVLQQFLQLANVCLHGFAICLVPNRQSLIIVLRCLWCSQSTLLTSSGGHPETSPPSAFMKPFEQACVRSTADRELLGGISLVVVPEIARACMLPCLAALLGMHRLRLLEWSWPLDYACNANKLTSQGSQDDSFVDVDGNWSMLPALSLPCA